MTISDENFYRSFLNIGNVNTSFQKGDEALNVRFYKKIVEDGTQFLDNGKPVTYLADFIDIRTTNYANLPNVVTNPVNNSHKLRFPKHWALYQAQESKDENSKQLTGYSLREWAYLSKRQVDMLEMMGYETIEQVAHMSLTNAQLITGSMGISGSILKEKAQTYLGEKAFKNVIAKEVEAVVEAKNGNTSKHTVASKSSKGK